MPKNGETPPPPPPKAANGLAAEGGDVCRLLLAGAHGFGNAWVLSWFSKIVGVG